MALIHDIVASASNVGYNKFILLVAHGADSSILPVVHKLGMEGYFCIASTGMTSCATTSTFWKTSCGIPTRPSPPWACPCIPN